ncbi:MAG: 30S ribosomal protein S9 [Elusimicrobiota bacterium]|nr:30S ribosomal protein S9 [Elusimicrobiota bacterium]MDH5661844.1 30S ribosomal protein S9 [Elusimicrobiota bacterium]
MAKVAEFWGVGRRKTAIARVILRSGNGKIVINRLPLDKYFSGLPGLKELSIEPLKATNLLNKFDILANVSGGGKNGQAGAIRHGISRALAKIDEQTRLTLRKEGLLTRDPRMVERKKPGQPKARKRFQFSKR